MNIRKESVYKKCLGRNPLYRKPLRDRKKICHAAQPVPQPQLIRELSNYCNMLELNAL